MFDARSPCSCPDRGGELEPALADEGRSTPGDKDLGVAEWVVAPPATRGRRDGHAPVGARALRARSRRRAGASACSALYPVARRRGWAIPTSGSSSTRSPGLVGSAIERTQLAEEARRAQLRVETEQLRNALLSSVSHDLRTPLAVVTGRDEHAARRATARRTMRRAASCSQTAHEEALRLNRLVRNLLDMTRLEAGALKVQKELQPLEEVVGAALDRHGGPAARPRGARRTSRAICRSCRSTRRSSSRCSSTCSRTPTKYTPAGTPIDVARARARAARSRSRWPTAARASTRSDAERVFDKFYRVREGEGGGVGLGLTICRGIVSAHGGRIWVEERAGGGASFRFTLPLEKAAPSRLELPESAMRTNLRICGSSSTTRTGFGSVIGAPWPSRAPAARACAGLLVEREREAERRAAAVAVLGPDAPAVGLTMPRQMASPRPAPPPAPSRAR